MGHSYDVAKGGYVTLRPPAGPRHDGDDAAMVAARVLLLRSGAYDGLAARVSELAATAHPGSGVVVDAGAGTGHYLARTLAALGERGPLNKRNPHRALDTTVGVALDASPYALRRAARAHPSIAAVGCDLWQPWPLRAGVAGLVLGVFAPRNGEQTRRVLRQDGSLLVVTPAPGHLAEVVTALGLLEVDVDKAERVSRSLGPYLARHSAEGYEERLRLTRPELAALVGMGPSARHLDPGSLAARIRELPDPIEVTLSVRLERWLRRSP